MDVMAVVRAVHMAATVLTAGAFAFEFLVIRRAYAEEQASACKDIERWLRLAGGWGVSLALVSWLIWFALVAASMSGSPLGQALSAEVLHTVLTQTTFGQVWMLRFALMVLLGGELFLSRRRGSAARPALGPVGASLAVGLLVTLAWAGHAVGTERSVRPFHLTADALHLLGAGLWLGALIPLLLVLGRARTSPAPAWHALAATATRRFSTLGVVAVVTLLVTGLINAWFLVGSFPALIDTSYGRLVSTKLALFAIIVLIAAFNRVKLTPRLTADSNRDDMSQAALERLWRNVIAEICLGAIVIAIVGGLGTTPPSFHKHGPAQHHMHAGAANHTEPES
ncbi:copper homeostasis membrane protein CopD [Piscinibacter sp.]|jgi:putative copper resistance protein D|uniref:copper homeostasis membrane protein CopD n=1 Tax=Piscinibacter sp. TaxID=1903157 RepID=UPI00355990B0